MNVKHYGLSVAVAKVARINDLCKKKLRKMTHRPLRGACRCAFFADKAKIARWYSPIRVIAETLADGQHYTLAQLRELAGTTCARKSISLLKEQGYKISSKRIPHSNGKKEYWLVKSEDDEG